MRPPPPLLVLCAAVAGISIAGPLIRVSDAHPVAIAVWRLAFSLPIVALMLSVSGQWKELRTLRPRQFGIGAMAGVMLALHFWSWNASVDMTSIAASVSLVNLQPVFVALLSVFWLRESPGKSQWVGIAIALGGALVVGLAASGDAPAAARATAMLGNLLAVTGAITAAIYYSAGRRLRQALALWPYVAVAYSACFATLLVIAAVGRVPLLPQPPAEFGIFAALALGPMMLGHTGMNYALRYLPAYVVNLAVLGEPIGATLIAALLPGIREIPSIPTLVGGMLVLAGILVTMPRSSGRGAPRNTQD